MRTVKMVDESGNVYVFITLASDVDMDSPEDVLSSAQGGITKLVAYKLAGDKYRDVHHNELGYKAVKYNNPQLPILKTSSIKNFGDKMKDILDKNRELKATPITSWRNMKVDRDARGLYVSKTLECYDCGKEIPAKHRLSVSGTEITRSQLVEPEDKRAERVGFHSRNWRCGACVSAFKMPLAAKIKPEKVESDRLKSGEMDTLIETLEELKRLSNVDSGVTADYFRGYFAAKITGLLDMLIKK